jgi:hypothetical protein
VKKSESQLQEMLRYTNGGRRVPVIVEEGRVTVGHEGAT